MVVRSSVRFKERSHRNDAGGIELPIHLNETPFFSLSDESEPETSPVSLSCKHLKNLSR